MFALAGYRFKDRWTFLYQGQPVILIVDEIWLQKDQNNNAQWDMKMMSQILDQLSTLSWPTIQGVKEHYSFVAMTRVFSTQSSNWDTKVVSVFRIVAVFLVDSWMSWYRGRTCARSWWRYPRVDWSWWNGWLSRKNGDWILEHSTVGK